MYLIENRVQDLKDCAKTILNNAESIVGTENFQGDLTVYIRLNCGEQPYINVDRDIYPEHESVLLEEKERQQEE